MKLNFYFIHGWGFDRTFWEPVRKKIALETFCASTFCLDLNFFSKNHELDSRFKKKSIFIVHSYGFQWFLKNKISCDVLINFFGVPDFVNFQKSPNLIKKKITKMYKLINKDPNKVLKDFHKTCNLEFKEKKIFNIKNLSNALDELNYQNYQDIAKSLNFRIFSIFSSADRVLRINKESLSFLKNKNHDIKILKDLDHGFPNSKPDHCCDLIKEILRKIYNESI